MILGAPGFEATDVQVQLMDKLRDGRYRIIGFGGGIRGTKTWGGLGAIVTLCRVFPRTRWAVVRKDLPRIKHNLLPSFSKLRERFGGFVGEVNQSTWTATCTNGSEIIFFPESLDVDKDLSRWKGLEVNGFLLEEADELAEQSFVKALERAGAWIVPEGLTQPPPYVICTFNPCANWPKRVFYEPWKHDTIAPPYAFIPATAADNPYVPEAQREAWKAMPAHEYKRFVEGDWEALSGRFYDMLNPKVHLLPREELPDDYPGWWEYWGSFDWGYGHWAVAGGWAKDGDGLIYLLDSVWVRQAQDDEIASAVMTRLLPQCWRVMYAGGDVRNKPKARGGTGVSTQEVFAEHGVYLVPGDNDPIQRGKAIRRALGVRAGRPGVVIVDTPNNRRVFDQLAETMPDPNNIDKPLKVDADGEGRGGDDGHDMFGFGLAAYFPSVAVPQEPRDPVHQSLSLKEMAGARWGEDEGPVRGWQVPTKWEEA